MYPGLAGKKTRRCIPPFRGEIKLGKRKTVYPQLNRQKKTRRWTSEILGQIEWRVGKTRHWTAQILGQIAGWDMGQSDFKVVRRFYAMGVGPVNVCSNSMLLKASPNFFKPFFRRGCQALTHKEKLMRPCCRINAFDVQATCHNIATTSKVEIPKEAPSARS